QAVNGNAAHVNDHQVATVSSIPTVTVSRPSNQTSIRTKPALEPKSTTPFNSSWHAASPVSPPKAEPALSPVEPSILSVASAAVSVKSPVTVAAPPPATRVIVQSRAPTPSSQVQAPDLPQPFPSTRSHR